MLFSIYLCLLSGLATPLLAYPGSSLAEPAVQAIVPRASYIGGWPLALDGSGNGCPSDTPVVCESGNTSLNPQCCPSGNTCIGNSLITAYCCPSANDCKTAVTNFPACANTTWVMYEFSYGYFCCEEGQIAVNPITGYDGLCVPSDRVVPQSLLASAATQIGGATSTSVSNPSSTTPDSSSQATSPTSTEATSLTGASSSGSSSNPTGTGSSSASETTAANSGSGSSNNTSKSSNSLGIGPIIGIAIGGVGLILLAGIFYALMRRRRPIPSTQPQIHYMPAPGVTELAPTVGRKPVPHTMATSMYSSANPGVSPGGYGTQPPQYGEVQHGEGEQRYDPPNSPPPQPSRTPQPYETYAEMEGRNNVSRAELRADWTGN